MSITVVGSVALDTIETPCGRSERCLGGSASHFSLSASYFTDVKLVGVVGADFPQKHLDLFRSHHIDLTGLQIIPDGKTFFWAGRYDDVNVAQTLETQLNVFEQFKPALPATYQNADVLFLANIHPDLQSHVIAHAGKPGLIALDTMNLWINTTRESLERAMAQVDVITINDGEVKLLTGENNLPRAVEKLQARGPKTIVVKRGEYGAVLFHGDQCFSAPALPVKVVKDPTGAGDTFAGGMMGYLDRQKTFDFVTLKTAVICGSVMSSFNVQEFSCERLKNLTTPEIMARFEEFMRLTKFERVQW
ncbi:MAG: hypothetical protein ACD_62C00351G0002 [uncultured bacterium]|nr:MAG: hypothetical protein ACD_62C00351G0002 [uncultured bacterium]HLD45808.1 PfkB family carbohydrate kinase [bacterium]